MPDNAPNDFERIVQKLVDDIDQSVERLPEADGPLGARKLNQTEQLQRYLEVVDDPQKWFDLIQQQGLRPVVEYALKMQPLYDKVVENA